MVVSLATFFIRRRFAVGQIGFLARRGGQSQLRCTGW